MRKGARGIGALVSVERGSGRAVYAQIVDSLRAAIEQGALAPRERLASTRTLARDRGVSRNTVLQAFDTLLAEGNCSARRRRRLCRRRAAARCKRGCWDAAAAAPRVLSVPGTVAPGQNLRCARPADLR